MALIETEHKNETERDDTIDRERKDATDREK